MRNVVDYYVTIRLSMLKPGCINAVGSKMCHFLCVLIRDRCLITCAFFLSKSLLNICSYSSSDHNMFILLSCSMAGETSSKSSKLLFQVIKANKIKPPVTRLFLCSLHAIKRRQLKCCAASPSPLVGTTPVKHTTSQNIWPRINSTI